MSVVSAQSAASRAYGAWKVSFGCQLSHLRAPYPHAFTYVHVFGKISDGLLSQPRNRIGVNTSCAEKNQMGVPYVLSSVRLVRVVKSFM